MPYCTPRRQTTLDDPRHGVAIAAMKNRQSAKIQEFAHTLSRAGLVGLDDQARALGLSRSTAWTIISASHKSTGISPAIIDRMLASSSLPSSLRVKIIEYVEERAAGLYGHNRAQRRRFVEALASNPLAHRRLGHFALLEPDMDVEEIAAAS